MAEDMKETLKRIKNSEGKTYYWGFGTGKRKGDQKSGEGAFRVFKSKASVKKKEFQDLCDCTQFLQGKCWGAGDTIKFSGKGLSGALLSKMKLSVKSEIGLSYDFELATDAE